MLKPWIATIVVLCAVSACGDRDSSSGRQAPTCGASQPAPLLAGELLETGTTSLELWSRGQRRPVACAASSPSFIAHPAFAPDGRRVAYVVSTPPVTAGQDWGDDIYVDEAGGGNARVVLAHSAQGSLITSLAWTPDGLGLIYGSFQAVYNASGQFTTAIYKVSRLALGSGLTRELLDKASQASLSWDGKQIVYVSYPTENLDRNVLAIANLDGSDPHPIGVSQVGFQDYYAPHLSPDGNRVVFAAVGGPVGRRETPPEPDSGPLRGLAGRLSPPRATADGAPYAVWIVNLDGSDLHLVANLREDLPFPLWSADGRQILFLGAAALYLANADGSEVKQIDKGVAHGQIAWQQPPPH